MRTKVLIGILVFVIVADCFSSADPETNVEHYPIDGPTVFNVGGRELTIVEMWGQGISVYTDVESPYPVLYKGTLAEDVVFVHGEVSFLVPGETVVAFHRSGSLRWTTAIAEDTAFPVNRKMVEVLAEHSIYAPLFFYENGTLEKAILARETELTVAGMNIRCVGYVGFGETGQMTFCTPAEEMAVPYGDREVVIAANSSLEFHTDGSLHKFSPGNKITVTVQNLRIPLRAGSEVTLYEDGSVQSCILTVGQRLMVGGRGFPAAAGYSVKFHPDGSLEFAMTSEETEVEYQGAVTTVNSGCYVRFNRTGEAVSIEPVY